MPIFYAPDEDVLKGVSSPPQDNQEAPDSSEEHPDTPSDTTSDGDTEDDDFLSAESLSSLSDNDTPEDDNDGNPERTTDNKDPDPNGENAPESDPPPREDPGDDP